MLWANNSFPVPVSPYMSTVVWFLHKPYIAAHNASEGIAGTVVGSVFPEIIIELQALFHGLLYDWQVLNQGEHSHGAAMDIDRVHAFHHIHYLV